MKRLPLLVDDNPSPLVRAGVYLLVPIAVILLLPILLFVILAMYLLALFQGARCFVFYLRGKEDTFDLEIRKPHFLERRISAPSLPDETKISE